MAVADQLLAEVVEQLPTAIAVLDRDLRYMYGNPALDAAHGPLAVGRTVHEVAPQLATELADLVGKVLDNGEPVLGVELIGREGTHWSTSVHPLAGSGGAGLVAVVASDMTELVGARQALLRSRAHSLALQQAQVPWAGPSDELDIAVRRAGAGAGNRWFDVLDLGAGRVGLVVGEFVGDWADDLGGSAAPAAVLSGQLMAAIRACARRGVQPVEVLDVLDGAVADLPGDVRATCLYAVFDPHLREMQLACAGHLPPVLRSPAGGAEVVSVDTTGLLGTGAVARITRLPLPAGSVVALYTGGLVRRPGRDPHAGVLALAAALVRGPRSLVDLADSVVADLGPGGDGDVLLLVQTPEDIASRSRSVVVPVSRDRGRAGEVRDLVRAAGREWTLLPELTDVAVLLASELVTNALVHGHGPIEARLRLTRDRLVVEVSDGSHQLPRRSGLREHDERGRGLHLVSMLSHRWGARPTDVGKVVWAELNLAAP